ncbi:phosphoribosylglycinamide synthetase, partial [mine drainage metagenome]
SIGVVRADNLKELKEALEITDLVISEMALNDQVTLIESYIGGTEFAVELLVVEGKVHVLAIFEKPDPLEGPYFEETIYITPPRISKSDYEVIVASMDLCIKALEISNGPMHIEVRVRPDGVVFPIDIATRSIGGNCSDVLNFDGMVSLETLIISNALNLEMPNISRRKTRPPASI